MTWLYVLGGAWLYAVAGVATYRTAKRSGFLLADMMGVFWPVTIAGVVVMASALAPFRWWDRRVERRRVEAERMARLLAEVESELQR